MLSIVEYIDLYLTNIDVNNTTLGLYRALVAVATPAARVSEPPLSPPPTWPVRSSPSAPPEASTDPKGRQFAPVAPVNLHSILMLTDVGRD
eukprot:6731290-Pyramimonas_sp.AAC.1